MLSDGEVILDFLAAQQLPGPVEFSSHSFTL